MVLAAPLTLCDLEQVTAPLGLAFLICVMRRPGRKATRALESRIRFEAAA